MKHLVLVTLIVLTTVAPAAAAPVVGFGGEGGFAYDFRDDAISARSLPTASNLRSLGAHLRVPYRDFEFSAVGIFAWRTVNFTDSLGVADLAYDDVVTTLSLRRMIPVRQFRLFGGFGPAVHRVRYALDPLAGRSAPSRSFKIGAAIEAGLYWQTPLPRLEVGGGVRHITVPDPTGRFTLYWIGFTVWTPRT